MFWWIVLAVVVVLVALAWWSSSRQRQGGVDEKGAQDRIGKIDERRGKRPGMWTGQ
jgi:hypothetical protein